MGIEQIGSIQKVNETLEVSRKRKVAKEELGERSDKVTLSSKSRESQRTSTIVSRVEQIPDTVRAEKVAEARARVRNGDYLSRRVYERIAEQLLSI